MVAEDVQPAPWLPATASTVNDSPGPSTVGFATGGSTTRSDGGPGSTVMSKVCVAARPPGSVAVTVTAASPSATLATVSVLPATAALATPGFEEAAPYSRSSPSGSRKYDDTFIDSVFPAASAVSGMVPSRRGVRFPRTTLTRKLWVAERPPGSVAVTVMVTVPVRLPLTVTLLPETLTSTLVVLDEVAVYVRPSPSGSLKYGATSNETDRSISTVRFSIVPSPTGAWLGTVTWKLWLATRPAESRAVTVTVALPPATPATVSTPPATAAVARLRSDEEAK